MLKNKTELKETATLIRDYLMLQKRVAQIESWLEAVKEDGRVHGKVITNGAVTGRMTHSSPNMAQIPASSHHPETKQLLYGMEGKYGTECRECWTVDEGNVLVGCDASGLELRMLAHYMKDEGDAKIGSIIGGNSKDGERLKDKFLRSTPALSSLLERVRKQAAKGWVPGLDGRRIWVRSEHAALNSLLQGAGAIVMKKALCIFYDKIKDNKWPVKLVANVHDEFQFECKKEVAEEAGKAARMSIIEAGQFYQLRCPLDGEYKIGKSWRETH